MSTYASNRASWNADRRGSSHLPPGSRAASALSNADHAKMSVNGHIGFGGLSRSRTEPRPAVFSAAKPTGPSDMTRPDSLQRRGSGSRKSTVWTHEASLIPVSSAPLACRVSVPPPALSASRELQPRLLNSFTQSEQEHIILEDLLFCFMGFEGQYIQFSEDYNAREEKARLAGPEYRIAPGLDPSLRDLAVSMLRIAKCYITLEAFVEVQSREEFGTVNQALCAEIRKLLKDYLTLVAQLEHQLLTNDDFTLHLLNLHTKPTAHMLMQLHSLTQEILKKNAILEEDVEESELDDVDNLIESLREGNDPAGLGNKKVCKGGSVLGVITNRLSTMSGDPAARALLTSLLREASRPYMTMLNEWLHQGSIRDQHNEFLIREQKSIKREGLEQDYTDEYWEKRYTLREQDVPPQLQGVKEKVLLAGKYLNVVRECGGVDMSKEVRDVPSTFDDPRFLDNVNGAYANANSSLLSLLLTTHSLPARLRSLKHYFFLDRSSYFSYFLELSNSELRKPAKAVNTGKLQSLLDIVLRQPGSIAAADPFKEDVKVQMNEIGLTTWLMRVVNVTGIDQDAADKSMANLFTPAVQNAPMEDKEINGFDALVLDYAVPFPLSLVISRVTLTRYQLLFRYLLSLRHLETLLTNSWVEQNKGHSWRHRSSNSKIETWKRKAWTLRARMLVFVQQLLYYSSAEVIEPNWQSLMSRLNHGTDQPPSSSGNIGSPVSKASRTVDEVMQDHVDFLATCLKECMLTNSKLLKVNSKVLSTCTMFATYTASLSRQLYAADEDLSSQAPPTSGNKATQKTQQPSQVQYDPKKIDIMIDYLDRYEHVFSRHLKILLDMLNYLAATETVVFLSLCARLSIASEGGPGNLADSA